MKLVKNKNILLIGLSLILSLVSFTGVANDLPKEAIKTALVVSNYNANARFSIPYQKAIKKTSDIYIKYSKYSFAKFQKNYNLRVITAFNNYTYRTLGHKTEQLFTKLYTSSIHQTLYNSIA